MNMSEWMTLKGYGCESGEVMYDYTTTTEAWEQNQIGSFQVVGWRDAVTDGLLELDEAAIQLVVDQIVDLHACLSESELGAHCPVFVDAPQESNFAWLADWAGHIERKHGGVESSASKQIADIIRVVVGVNPYSVEVV